VKARFILALNSTSALNSLFGIEENYALESRSIFKHAAEKTSCPSSAWLEKRPAKTPRKRIKPDPVAGSSGKTGGSAPENECGRFAIGLSEESRRMMARSQRKRWRSMPAAERKARMAAKRDARRPDSWLKMAVALWTLYNFPKARLMYMSATWLQAPTCPNCFSTSICDFDGTSLDSASPGVTSHSISLSGGLYGQSTARSECTEQKGKVAIGPALRDLAIFVLLILDHLVRQLVSVARLAGKCSLRTAPTF
jgi:hypothetical protein